jgi:predicted nucleic acid-binding protein
LNLYVLDASVAAKWFLPAQHETLAEEALALLGEYAEGHVQLSVPDLFWPEFGNILWKAVRLGRITKDSARKAIISLRAQKIATSQTAPLLEDALDLAMAFDRSVYDCVYVALAVATNRMLVTADERLANALAAYLPVRWLGAV